MRNALLAAVLCMPWGLRGQPQPIVSSTSPLTIDLADALNRARVYSPQFLAAGVAASLAREDKLQAKAALFPTVEVINGYIYTQGNGTPAGVFVSNNGVHVYDEQAAVHAEVFSFAKRAEYHRAIAAEAATRARQDIARRGLATTVVTSYYGVVTAQHRIANAQRSLDEARNFEDITLKQEQGGETAHADVVKAQLTRTQRERELAEALANLEKAKLALAVIIFQDLNQAFTVVDDLQAVAPVTPVPEIQQRAIANSPDLILSQSTPSPISREITDS